MRGTDAAFALGVMHVPSPVARHRYISATLGYGGLEARAFDPRVARRRHQAAEVQTRAIANPTDDSAYGVHRTRGGGNGTTIAPGRAWRDAPGVLLSTGDVCRHSMRCAPDY
jgi:hypothetical protein